MLHIPCNTPFLTFPEIFSTMYFQNVFLCLKVKLLENENPVFVRRADARLFLSILAAGLLSFTGVVIETAMNVTFPTLMEEFSVGTSTVQWLTTGYLLVLATVIPTSSYLKQPSQEEQEEVPCHSIQDCSRKE